MSDLKEQGLIKGFNFADTLEDIPEDKKLNSINFVKASSTGFVTSAQLNNALENKVDKETGKSLSQNDFTNEDKSRVDLISTIGDGTKYLSDDGIYKTLDIDSGIPEAPIDGKIYGRQNASWEEISVDDSNLVKRTDNEAFPDSRPFIDKVDTLLVDENGVIRKISQAVYQAGFEDKIIVKTSSGSSHYVTTKTTGQPAHAGIATFDSNGHLGSEVTPTEDWHYTRKGYVDNLIANIPTMPEAPIDNKAYARKNSDWVETLTKVDIESAIQSAILSSWEAEY